MSDSMSALALVGNLGTRWFCTLCATASRPFPVFPRYFSLPPTRGIG
jgi:hypothetical protein